MRQRSPLPLCHRGCNYPLGSTLTHIEGKAGVNFALMSRYANKVELCLFDVEGRETRIHVTNRSNDVWHVFVVGIEAGQRYGWRVDGDNTAAGSCFNPNKLLLDPYAKVVDGLPQYRNDEELALFQHTDSRDNAHVAAKSVVVAPSDFQWEGDTAPRTLWRDTVIYEAHVKGFSQLNPDVPKDITGSFAGMAHEASIRHLKALGITAVELLPVSQHLDEVHLQRRGLRNYWGYNVFAHYAVDIRYGTPNDFKQLVKTLHREGIEVILDVVFNHGAEQDIYGPMLCQRGIDNRYYYWLDEHGNYINDTGCGNAFNLSQPAVMQWAMDCLRYWVQEYHVDGFRFDLAATLGRMPAFSSNAPFFAAIQQDPILAGCKMIAEPWDIGMDGYQLGHFSQRFSEWNGRFRDDMRGFWLWENGWLGALAQRFCGSDDIFRNNWRAPHSAINLITAHDGFTLRDLVSYGYKHNEANGEDNRDGENHNYSWNHGVEGNSDNETINTAREHSQKALLACLLLAHGVPMLLAGDELNQSQRGNNNSYCQDNEITWLDWESGKTTSLMTYIQSLTAQRRRMAQDGIYDGWWHHDNARWFNASGEAMQENDWHNEESKALALLLQEKYLVLFNANRSAQTFVLPDGGWQPLFGEGLSVTSCEARLAHLGVCVLTRNSAEKKTFIGETI
ncbi:MAG: glycogen debranching protein GlgX [Cardiobacteriaceae bacterium]|nr:glycogen debranching protein GlgX [Cardiobacteriaceae bacterium]